MNNSMKSNRKKTLSIFWIILIATAIVIVVSVTIIKQRGHEIDAPYGPREITVEETDSSFGPLEQELND